jgi:hypothetical protein
MLRSEPFNVTTGMWLASANEATRRRNASPICCRQGRGRGRVAAVAQELDHLPAHLQLAQVAMQVEPVQAFQIERHVPVQHVIYRDRHRPPDP